MRSMLLVAVLVAACGKERAVDADKAGKTDDDDDKPTKSKKKPADDDDDDKPAKSKKKPTGDDDDDEPPRSSSTKSLCKRACKKILDCIDAPDDERADCVEKCAAGTLDKRQVEAIEDLSCTELAKKFPLGGQGRGAAPAAGGGCTADCRGCAGDNSSCYAIAGGAHGIPCDPCCCAPGGPSPTWRTPE